MTRLSSLRRDVAWNEIYSKFQRWQNFKLPFEGNMFLNLAFYYGFQWTIYNIASGELTQLENPANNIRLTSNQIQPRIRNLLAKLTKNKPIMEAIPNGWTEEALHSSQVSKALLNDFREIHNEDELDAMTVLWFLTCGDCFRKIGFDPGAGTVEQVDQTIDKLSQISNMDPGQGPDMLNQLGFDQVNGGNSVAYNEGEVYDDVIPSFEIYTPEYAKTEMGAVDILHVKIIPVSDVKLKWGARAANITPYSAIAVSNQFQQRLLGMANPDSGSSTGITKNLTDRPEELTYYMELWKRPTREHRKGRLMIAAGSGPDGVLYNEDNPFYEAFQDVKPLRRLEGIPFIRFRCIDAPGRYWSISPIEPMRPLQAEYNKTITDLVQNRATVGRNKIIAPKTANLDKEEVANIHGQILEYTGIKGPDIFPAMALPQQVERETERNRQDMDTVSGSHEVSRSKVPQGVKSGIAINYLLEQDDTSLSPIIKNYEHSKRQVALCKLALAKQFYSGARILQLSEVQDMAEVIVFSANDISTNIRVVPGSAQPQSKAALQATYLDLFNMGVFLDDQGQPDTQRLFELLRTTMPLEAVSQEENLDMTRANRENMYLSVGEQIVPAHYENHILHIKRHNKFRKGERFYTLPDQIKQSFDIHVSIHMEFLGNAMRSPVSVAQERIQEGPPNGKPGGQGGNRGIRRSPSSVGEGTNGPAQQSQSLGNYG
jgi:hypothetical protein